MIHQWDDIQTMLRDSARTVCRKIKERRRPSSDQLSELWRQATELGWTGVALPEEHGGSGGGLLEAGIVASEMGRAALFGGYAETMALGFILARVENRSDCVGEWLTEMAKGRLELRLIQRQDPSLGTSETVIAFASAPRAIFVRLEGDALVASPLDKVAPQSVRTSARSNDFLVSPGRDNSPVTIVSGVEAATIWDSARRAHRCLTAAYVSGAVRTLLDIAVDYSRIRSQFGHPIGSYQAVQHAVTDILAGVDGAELAIFKALSTLSASPFEECALADTSVAFARESSWTALIKTYDIMGGVGFVEEHELSKYTRGMLPLIAGMGTAAECEEGAAHHVRRGMWLTQGYGEVVQ